MRKSPDQLERPREAAAKTVPGGAWVGVVDEVANPRSWADVIISGSPFIEVVTTSRLRSLSYLDETTTSRQLCTDKTEFRRAAPCPMTAETVRPARTRSETA